MKENTKIFYCDKCKEGHINMTVKYKDDEVEVNIKKCDKCGYQYFIKELFDAKLQTI